MKEYPLLYRLWDMECKNYIKIEYILTYGSSCK